MENITRGAIRAGWEILKKRPWFIVFVPLGANVLVYLLSSVLDEIAKTGSFASLLTGVGNIAAYTLLNMGITAFFLKAYDDPTKVVFTDLWHPQPFWNYFAASVIAFILTLVGLLLFIVPGIIIAITLAFWSYLVIDRELGPIEALKESARLTRGRRWQLFVFFLLLVIFNILGFLALIVGVFITIPVSTLASVHVFRALQQESGALTPVSA